MEQQKNQLSIAELQIQLEKIVEGQSGNNSRIYHFLKIFFHELLSSVARQNYQKIFNFDEWGYEIQNPSQSPICAKSIQHSKIKTVFKCYDCSQYDSGMLCYDCFTNSNHKGHSFRQFTASSGSCDCGDSQIWSQKGFCQKHTKKSHEIVIQENIKNKFLREMKILMYLYLVYEERSDLSPLIRLSYGNILFAFIKRLLQENYEMKILVYHLFSSNLNSYPHLSKNKAHIMQHLFNLNPQYPQLKKLTQIIIEMFPVDDFKFLIIQQYFQLQKSNLFSFYHPLKQFNFQYLICVKFICRMIENKDLKPLAMDPNKFIVNSTLFQSSIKKYYEDLMYLSQMNKSNEYHLHHFKMTNIVDMAFYRKFTTIQNQFFIQVDQFFAKLLGVFIKSILIHRELIHKSLRQLFEFIVNFDLMTYSMAQQRAFALFLIAFSNGSLHNLQTKQLLNQLLDAIELQSFKQYNVNGQAFFKKLIKKALKNKMLRFKNPVINIQNGYEKYFYFQFPQLNFVQHLDSIYHKFLYLISQKHVDYSTVILQFFMEEEEQQELDNHAKLLCMQFVVDFTISDIDQIVIANFLSLQSIKQKVLLFYNRLLYTFNNKLTIDQFTKLAKSIVSNDKLIDEFIKNHANYQNQKLSSRNPVEPLQKLFYKSLLRNMRYLQDVKLVNSYITHHPNQIFKNYIFGCQLIEEIIKKFTIILQLPPSQLITSSKTIQSAINLLLKIFILNNNEFIKQTLNIILQSYSNILNNETAQLIYSLIKDKSQMQNFMDKQIHDKQEVDKNKRKKIDAKKKDKEFMMKLNQQKILKAYHMQQQSSKEQQICIYCRQSIQEVQRYVMCYVSITNFISKHILKQNKYHIYFKSCGHKVHKICYNKYLQSSNAVKSCFLCKRKANIIFPQSSYHLDHEIFNQIYLTLISEIDEKEQEALNYLQQPFLINLMISFCRQLLYNDFNKWNSIPYLSLYQLFKSLDKEYLAKNFQQIDNEIGKEEIQDQIGLKLQKYQVIIYSIIKSKLLSSQDKNITNIIQNNQQNGLIKFLELFINGEPINIQNLTLINQQQLFIKLPQNIQVLHSWMGDCPVCKIHTNWLYYCLFCNWMACSRQTSKIHQHQQEHHSQGSIFICAANGRLAYICSGIAKNQESLYLDEFYEPYAHDDKHLKKQLHKQYKLKLNALDQGLKIILNHEISNMMQ